METKAVLSLRYRTHFFEASNALCEAQTEIPFLQREKKCFIAEQHAQWWRRAIIWENIHIWIGRDDILTREYENNLFAQIFLAGLGKISNRDSLLQGMTFLERFVALLYQSQLVIFINTCCHQRIASHTNVHSQSYQISRQIFPVYRTKVLF